MDLKEEAALGAAIDRHWYYQSKARLLAAHARKHLGRRGAEVLDIGAGSGWFSRWMLESGLAERAVLVDPGYLHERAEGGLRYVRSIERSEAEIVLMMDVLEHVDDDVALLREYLGKTPPGTPFFITVPAFAFLWSAHDEFLEHRRRYTAGSLARTVRAAGAEPEALHYYFGAVFPLAAAVRLWRRGASAERSDMQPQGAVVNAVLSGVCAAERAVMRANRVAGLTVVCVCRRGSADRERRRFSTSDKTIVPNKALTRRGGAGGRDSSAAGRGRGAA